MRSRVVAAFLIGIGTLTPATTAFAQASSAIAGLVRDSSGAVLPGVTIEVASPALIERVRSAVSDEQGQYPIVGLVPGIYTVTFSLQGFSAFKREGIDLPNNFTATVNAEMRVGGIEETITVSGQSPVVDVQNAAARNQITREALDTIPTNKTLEAFAALTPGVSMAQTIGQDVGGSKGETYVQLRIHGTRTGDNKTLVDGFETNDYSGRVFVPNPASAGEVSIELGNGPGEAPANGVYVNFVPRDGGNQFHGSIFGTYTGPGFQSEPNLTDDLISRGLSQSDLGKVLRIWDVNGSLGGPIARDRLWFHHATRSWGSGNAVVGAYYNLTPTAWTYTADPSRPANDDFNNVVTTNRFTLQATQKNKFNVSYDWEYRCDCHRSVSSTLAPEASGRREVLSEGPGCHLERHRQQPAPVHGWHREQLAGVRPVPAGRNAPRDDQRRRAVEQPPLPIGWRQFDRSQRRLRREVQLHPEFALRGLVRDRHAQFQDWSAAAARLQALRQ